MARKVVSTIVTHSSLGAGLIDRTSIVNIRDGVRFVVAECGDCDGFGEVAGVTCAACTGSGLVELEEA